MANIIKKLNDPKVVADFQRLCGIIRGPKANESHENSNGNGKHPGNERQLSKTNGISESIDLRYRRINDSDTNNDQTNESSSSDEDQNEEYHITNTLLYYLFHFAAGLGNEIFYITFFPFWFWNIDGYVGRRVAVFWCLFMYLGQATKDIVKWPRPSSPPVIHMEKRYALEYGMPSTHAMVGAGMPFSILYFTYGRYIFQFEYGFAMAFLWCVLVCFSRIYLGMHSILDVLAGLAYVFLLMPITFPFLNSIDEFMLTSSWSPYCCVLVPLTLALCYPKLEKWSTARGDTTVILAVSAGLGLGHWFSFQYGFMQRCLDPPPYNIIPPSWHWFGLIWARLVIGVVILFSTRAVMKALVYNVICVISGIQTSDLKAKQSLFVELPDKFITYSCIAFNAVYLAPQVFRILGIERETFFTEI